MTLNPLFAVELRGRFRRLMAFLPLAGVIIAGAVALYLLLNLANTRTGLTVAQTRAQGALLLSFYQAGGALVYALIGVLVGAMAIVHEKEAGTWEHLLLCPLGAIGIVRGKISSALAFALLLQIALLPVLAALSAACFLTPGRVLWVVALHFGACAQGVTLGILGAIRARTIAGAFVGAVFWWLGGIVGLLAAFVVGGTLLYVIYALLNALFEALAFGISMPGGVALQLGWVWLGHHFFAPVGVGILAFAGGATGVGTLLSLGALTPLVLAGQLLAAHCCARWSAWQLHSPDRNLLGATVTSAANYSPVSRPAPQSVAEMFLNAPSPHMAPSSAFWAYLTAWGWHLSPRQIASFPLVEAKPVRAVKPAPKPKAAAQTPGGKRIRLIQARWLETLNPVLWLDLQRCLSLRAPGPGAQLPLLLFAALGGSMALAAGLASLVSLLAGGAGEAKLGQYFGIVHGTLCYLALLSGPVWGAMGYNIERRSMMLHELRLTLLSARGLWWGKFGARISIPVVAALPGLMLFQFFADNMGEAAPHWALGGELLLVISIASASLGACLWLSYHAPHQLAAVLWSLGFAALWGGGVWIAGAQIWAPLAVLSPFGTAPVAACAACHGALAIGAGGAIFWRLRRMGFG